MLNDPRQTYYIASKQGMSHITSYQIEVMQVNLSLLDTLFWLGWLGVNSSGIKIHLSITMTS